MTDDLKVLLSKLLWFFSGVILTILCIATLYLDINIFNSASSESSFTELNQELLLLAIILIYSSLAYKHKILRPSMVLVAGFFTCMFVREMDFWFGKMGIHWFPAVIVVAGACIFYAVRKAKTTVYGLARFSESQPFIFTLSGLLTVLVFSRLFGMSKFWGVLLGESYPRWVKIFAEEGLELFGYSLCFLGAALYWLHLRKIETLK